MTGRCAACGLPGHRYGRTDLYQAGWDAAIAAAAEAWELRRHAIL